MQKKQFFQSLVICFGLAVFLGLFGVVNNASAASGIVINNNKAVTKIRKVILTIEAPTNTRRMMIANNADFSDGLWEKISKEKIWYLAYGRGAKTVYLQFKDNNGKVTIAYTDTISLESPPLAVDLTLNQGQAITHARHILLQSKISDGVDSFRISTNKTLSDADFQLINTDLKWALPEKGGKYTVYVEYKDASGETKIISKPIEYQPEARRLAEGSLVKGANSPTIYYYGHDDQMHPFTTGEVYHSWFANFNNITVVADSKVKEYLVGDPMCFRAGTWLAKFSYSPVVYAIEPGCVLQPLRSEVEALVLYGANWTKRIITLGAEEEKLYFTKSLSIDNEQTGVVDEDGDGLDVFMEKASGSSDKLVDTDSDGLSDYEEIKYWFTGPGKADTDGDGYKDGTEILTGYQPIGNGKLTAIPTASYTHPIGTLFYDPSGKGGKYYISLANSKLLVSNTYFTANNFQEKFVVYPRYAMSFAQKKGTFGKTSAVEVRPKVRNNKGQIIDL